MIFSDYSYVPTIRTRQSELLGIEKLKPETKDKILLNVALAKIGRNSSVHNSFEKLHTAFSGTLILGLADNERLRVDEYDELQSLDNNFKNWFDFIRLAKTKNNNIIPSLIYNNNIPKRAFIKQLQAMEDEFGKIVLTINPLKKKDVLVATTAAAVIGELSNILFILDVGQVTVERQRAALDATIHSLNELRAVDQSIEVVSSMSSFPRMFQPYCTNQSESKGIIPMLEWENYSAIGGKEFLIYGDYAGIHGEFYEGSYAKFVARIDYPTPSAWIFERRRQLDSSTDRKELYKDAALSIITNECWDNDLDVWGADCVKDAAKGNLDNFGTPSKWISVRINLHIERMIQFLESGTNSSSFLESEEEDDEWGDW